jgi:hypothetical protein
MCYFLKKIFKWQPAKRKSAAELLQHPWMTKSYNEDDEREMIRDVIIEQEVLDM